MRRRKSVTLTLGITSLLTSAMLTGCDTDGNTIDADYAQVCREKSSELRVDDSKCSDQGRAGGYYGWYFFKTSSNPTIPAVGSKLSGGSATAPSTGSVKSGIPSKGSVVSRGGFGTSAKSGGSVGG